MLVSTKLYNNKCEWYGVNVKCLSVCLPVYLSDCLSVGWFVGLSVGLSIPANRNTLSHVMKYQYALISRFNLNFSELRQE